MSRLMDFFINTIFISLPEETFVVAFSLLVMGKGKELSFKPQDIKRFMLPTLSIALLSSFLRIVLQLEYFFLPFLSIALLIVTICFAYGIHDAKSILICSGTSILSFLAVGLIQFAYVPILINYSGITVEQLNTSGYLLFLCSLPERMIEMIVIAVLLSKSKAIIQVNPIKILKNDKTALAIFLLNAVFMLILVYVLTILVYMYNILEHLPNILKILVPMLVILVPLLSIGGMVAIVYLLSYKEAQKGFTIIEETKVINALVTVLSQKGEYRKICNEIHEFESQIKSLSIPGIKKRKERSELS